MVALDVVEGEIVARQAALDGDHLGGGDERLRGGSDSISERQVAHVGDTVLDSPDGNYNRRVRCPGVPPDAEENLQKLRLNDNHSLEKAFASLSFGDFFGSERRGTLYSSIALNLAAVIPICCMHECR